MNIILKAHKFKRAITQKFRRFLYFLISFSDNKKTEPFIMLRMTFLNSDSDEYNEVTRVLLKGGLYNGYVAIPKGHPYYGINYGVLDGKLSVHGGLTYSRMEGNLWVIGFDTLHYMDTQERWDVASVAKEAESLLKQVIEAGKPKEKQFDVLSLDGKLKATFFSELDHGLKSVGDSKETKDYYDDGTPVIITRIS